jgi:hypothetical protein
MLSLLRWHGLALRSDSSNRPSKVFWSGELAQAPSNFKLISLRRTIDAPRRNVLHLAVEIIPLDYHRGQRPVSANG